MLLGKKQLNGLEVRFRKRLKRAGGVRMSVNPQLGVVLDFVEGLFATGITDVCVSPGSRSTPLAIAFFRHGQFRVWTLLDERSAGYYAVGLARGAGRPVALVCTSGSAAANYLPALMEARQSRVPLVAITADRPPEMRGVGANQTADQIKLFGGQVKEFIEMPVPDGALSLGEQARATALRVASIAAGAPQGPVHVNWPFREPLIPPRLGGDTRSQPQESAPGGSSMEPSRSPARLRRLTGTLRLRSAEAAKIASELAGMRGVIVCGPQERQQTAEAVLALGMRLGYPILADPLSQLRALGSESESEWVIDAYDTLLRTGGRFAERPQVVLRFGQIPTSKALGVFLSEHSDVRQIVVDDDLNWRDPFFVATDIVYADPTAFCVDVVAQVPDASGEITEFARAWMQANRRTRACMRRAVDSFETVFEGRVFMELAEVLPEGCVLFTGNSMPVRDLDTFFATVGRRIRFLANRGVSGIDGVVSTAAGVAASGAGPVVLVLGDLSFYHDSNGLLACKLYALPLTVVLIHNDGGGIFSLLPQAAETDVFPLFATPHGLDFEGIARTYGASSYARPQTWSDFRRAVTDGMACGRFNVVEVRTDRTENARLHHEVFRQCGDA